MLEEFEGQIDSLIEAGAEWYAEHVVAPFVRATINAAIPPMQAALQEAIAALVPDWLEGFLK